MDFLRGSEIVLRHIMFFVDSKMSIDAFFAFLAGASEGLPFSRTKDPRKYGDKDERIGQEEDEQARGRLVELSARVCKLIDALCVGLFRVHGTRLTLRIWP